MGSSQIKKKKIMVINEAVFVGFFFVERLLFWCQGHSGLPVPVHFRSPPSGRGYTVTQFVKVEEAVFFLR